MKIKKAGIKNCHENKKLYLLVSFVNSKTENEVRYFCHAKSVVDS